MTHSEKANRTDIHRALEPASVAVVGASRDESKRGYMILQALDDWGYAGAVHPVNPKHAGEQIGSRDVYAAVSDIPGTVDLACIVTPAAVVPDVLEDCGAADVAGALVIAAGFGEIGNDDLEARLLEVADEHDIRRAEHASSTSTTDLLSRRDIPQGGIAMLSQSGNIASALVYEAMHEDAEGFSFYISVGNEADITFDEYLPYLADHDQTKMAMCYVEGMSDGRTFLQEASRFVREKPLTVLKGGLSSVGKQSAESHTASIAGRGSVIEDVYRQAGVVQVERADELLAVSDSLANLPPADGPNVGILSDGGGHATHAADCLAEHGLAVPDLEPETQARIREVVPEQAPNTVNPVDVLTLEYDIDIYADCAEAMLEDPNVDALLLCGYFGGYGINWGASGNDQEVAVAERIIDLLPQYDTPIVTQSMFAQHDSPALGVLDDSRIPVFESINTATRALAALETYGQHLAVADRKSDFVVEPGTTPSRIVTDARDDGRSRLSEYEARRLLEECDARAGRARDIEGGGGRRCGTVRRPGRTQGPLRRGHAQIRRGWRGTRRRRPRGRSLGLRRHRTARAGREPDRDHRRRPRLTDGRRRGRTHRGDHAGRGGRPGRHVRPRRGLRGGPGGRLVPRDSGHRVRRPGDAR